ncbi:MAG TPA: ribonuclease Y [Candidatus Polarisedimenticolaceae bacterium]|nr:ribonuclease Y [Candidatus Polarisedimenticolaceae bacterium]
MSSSLAPLVGIVLAAILVVLAVVIARRIVARAREQAPTIVEDARRVAEDRAHAILASAQEKALAAEEDVDRREHELDVRDAQLETRARQLETDLGAIDRQRKDLERRQNALAKSEEQTRQAQTAAEADRAEARRALERVAGLTAEEARAEMLASIEAEARREAARLARRIEEEAKEVAEREARRLLVDATQRVSLRDPVESTVTFIALPSDEMKGRIIGREGRNIRALEMATGIDVIIDDTPGAILLSSFDPVRREIARIALQRLVEDGRIHPARIEEVVQKVGEEFETLVEEAGSQAAFSLGVAELHPRLARLVGRLKFRHQYGHNLLQHAVEVVHLGAYMAAETGAKADVIRRAGLLHEIGRVEEGASGHPVAVAAELTAKFGERDEIVKAVQAMHPDAEAKTIEHLILRAANRLSDNRPGARKDNLDVFVERLRRLETMARSFPGVTQAFALKAGKELRVIVDTRGVTDDQAYILSKEIARAIERDLEYPGPIRVSVVRETRAVQYAV